jgi:hypothetical protein
MSSLQIVPSMTFAEPHDPLIVDLALSARLERTEALANARFVEARKRSTPESAAAWIDVGGAYAMFDGVDSPCTQTFGLGILGEPSQEHLADIESFFHARGAGVHHEISPLISTEFLGLLNHRNYRPIEFTNVLCRRIGSDVAVPAVRNPLMTVRIAHPEQSEQSEEWAHTSANGWSEDPEMKQLILGLARNFVATEGTTAMLVEIDGRPVATGILATAGGVALLSGASTIPAARNQGAQSSLLAERLQLAVAQGCDIAMMCALPGSPSQRNAQRNGFQIAYTRTKWSLQT